MATTEKDRQSDGKGQNERVGDEEIKSSIVPETNSTHTEWIQRRHHHHHRSSSKFNPLSTGQEQDFTVSPQVKATPVR